MSEVTEQSLQLFSEFVSSRKVLIVDPHAASRTGLAKLMVSIGAKTNHLLLDGGFREASEMLKKYKPEIVVSEYALEGGSGLDLSQQVKKYLKPAESLFVLVTANSSQSVVAQAAEEDVDVFILKPYNIDYFTETIVNSVLLKIKPSIYTQLVEEGKKLIHSAEFEKSIEVFNRAIAFHPKPSLALFYRGQAELVKKLIENAKISYEEGLKYNNIHYKCLTGLFELLMSQKKFVDAYKVVKKIAKIFPANPHRLSQVLTLAVQTGNFQDIEGYYEFFKELEVRDDELVKYTCAAMIVCGKHFLRSEEAEKGVSLLIKASASAAGKPNILREIIATLTENKRLAEARSILEKFPSASQGDVNYHVSRFLVFDLENDDKKKSLSMLMEFEQKKIEDPLIYYWLIRYCKKFQKENRAEDFLIQAQKKWPDRANYFQEVFDGEK
jgi:CheY-like chemotaxis protein